MNKDFNKNSFHSQDLFWMQQAIAYGNKARRISSPNPWVGAVVVSHGQEIGHGWTQQAGGPHAETQALDHARAQGHRTEHATLYVTLEPCNHQGKTPPCTQAIRDAKIDRVVIGTRDPDPLVSGKGIQSLIDEGMRVEVGCVESQVLESLAPYLHQRKTNMPYVVVKTASTLDGFMAKKNGESKWITDTHARQRVHEIRAESDAILIGAQTACVDLPQLTVRGVDTIRQPLRVVLDPTGRVNRGPLFDTKHAPTLMVTTRQGAKKQEKFWTDRGCQILIFEKDLEIEALLRYLAQQGIVQLMVEGGARTARHFLPYAKIWYYFVGARFFYDQGALHDMIPSNFHDQWKTQRIETFQDSVCFHFIFSK